ncbi:hypothetical protein [Pseudomonas sp. Bout1]|uniref:GMP synthase (glutamine-hydrolyzing) n=1 Tax=Pseudomonas sp. Bout1 TaxID=3048600 RepID=UPI003A59972F
MPYRSVSSHKISQAFVEFQSVKSVGGLGDCRRYTWGMALLAVETIDFTFFRDANV